MAISSHGYCSEVSTSRTCFVYSNTHSVPVRVSQNSFTNKNKCFIASVQQREKNCSENNNENMHRQRKNKSGNMREMSDRVNLLLQLSPCGSVKIAHRFEVLANKGQRGETGWVAG